MSAPSLADILSNVAPPPYTLTAFMAFLSNNHCLENLEFTLDAARYQQFYYSLSQVPPLPGSPDCERLRTSWDRLVRAYIAPGGAREVNLSAEDRDSLLRIPNVYTPPAPENLNRAVYKITELMRDSLLNPFIQYCKQQSVFFNGASSPNFGLSPQIQQQAGFSGQYSGGLFGDRHSGPTIGNSQQRQDQPPQQQLRMNNPLNLSIQVKNASPALQQSATFSTGTRFSAQTPFSASTFQSSSSAGSPVFTQPEYGSSQQSAGTMTRLFHNQRAAAQAAAQAQAQQRQQQEHRHQQQEHRRLAQAQAHGMGDFADMMRDDELYSPPANDPRYLSHQRHLAVNGHRAESMSWDDDNMTDDSGDPMTPPMTPPFQNHLVPAYQAIPTTSGGTFVNAAEQRSENMNGRSGSNGSTDSNYSASAFTSVGLIQPASPNSSSSGGNPNTQAPAWKSKIKSQFKAMGMRARSREPSG
ncbi:hypothetical protein PYCC9005_001408 [Savitreella phatthalungensis]